MKNILYEGFQVLRAFGIPQKKHLYFISVSGAFLETSLPPTPNWSRFDLFMDVYSILFYCISSYTLYFIFCILLGIACSTPPSFMGFCFFLLVFLPLLWCQCGVFFFALV